MSIRLKTYISILFTLFNLCVLHNSYAQVTASFTTNTSSGCPPLNISFTNTSTGAASYTWNFGNGNTSTATSPGAIFSTPGTFTVTLTATSGGGATSTSTKVITVFSNPVANFTTSTMPSCPGQAVVFTDNSTQGNGALSSWSWDFGDGNAQAAAPNSVSHAYGSAASFPVTMIVTDANGCSNSIIKTVTIAPAPVASFTANPISACAPPLLVNFNSTSTITGAVTYAWTFGDGNSSTQQNPSNTYNTSGGFNVSLTVTQGACTNTKTSPNFIGIQNIVADFSANTTAICEGYTVNFTDQSFPITANQSWNFGDGTTSTTTNPTHVYTTAGTYSVTLIEGTGSCQNTVTKTSYITVSPSPNAAFSANQTTSCTAPFPVVFSNTSAPGCIYTWDFGDGSAQFTTGSTSNFSYTYTNPGADSVTLLVTSGNGCITTLKKPAYIVISDPIADFSATPIQGCVPLLCTFNDNSTVTNDPIVNYSWNFGNGTASTPLATTTNMYNVLGTYTVKLVIQTTLGCKDSITKTNYIKTGNKPTANFSIVDPTVCYGTQAVFTDLSVGADSAYWEFDVNEGTFSTPYGAALPYNPVTNLFPDTGTFYVQQIAFNHGCADTLKINNIVRILPPKPIFTYLLSCVNLFTVKTHNATMGADSLIWDFGDGSPLVINDTAPTHTYANRGNQTITLTAYNFSNGCHSSAPETFTITQPIASFNAVPSKGCYPLAVAFNDSSQDANDLLWNFGDGGPPINATSPTVHVFTMPKQDTVKLIITDINGCLDSTTRIVTVYGPTPDFAAITTTGCVPLFTTFNDSSVSDSALVQWTWDFGDNTPIQTTNSPSINHTYTTVGFYTVTMTVTDINGCTKTMVRPNYIQPTYPSPSFVADTFACRNVPVIFDATATSAAGPATFNWNFGDGGTGTGIISTHAYTTDNTYTVTLTVTDVNGCDSTIQHTLLIQHPHTSFSDSVLLIGCGVTNMQFNDLSTGDSLTNWQWNFGDGASATQQNPVHAYTLPATYPVSLVVTNKAGCTDTLTNSVVVPGPTGTFSFTPSTGCPPLDVTFTAVSTTAISYTWDFGDGNVVTTVGPVTTHTYPTDIVATPALLLNFILSDGSTCQLPAPTAGQITVVTVFPTVIMQSDIDSGCYPVTINFTDLSTLPGTIPGDSITAWTWNFGDPSSGAGNTSTLQNPTHTYQQPGSFPVSLTVVSKGGCTNNSSLAPLTVFAYPYPIAAFSLNSNTFDLPYETMNTTNQSAGAITFAWNFGDGTSSTATSPSHLYTSIGIFQVQLVAVNQHGCQDTTSLQVITNADVVYPNAFTPNPDGGNGGEYTLTATNNDVFFPFTAGVVDYKLSIYDRWGELVFESLDVKKGWDGYYKGKVCSQDVYVWKAYVKLNNGKEYNKTGDVTLIR